jgi:hypothetical protein
MRWADQVLSMGEMRNACTVLGDNHLGEFSAGGEVILELFP